MYAVLQNRATRLTDDLNKAAMNLLIQLSFNHETVPSLSKRSHR
jgi:hypothetical protein